MIEMLRLIVMTFMDTNPQLMYKITHEKEKVKMPHGKGTYGSKRGRPPKKKVVGNGKKKKPMAKRTK